MEFRETFTAVAVVREQLEQPAVRGAVFGEEDHAGVVPLAAGSQVFVEPREDRFGLGIGAAFRRRGPRRELIEKTALFGGERDGGGAGFDDRFIDGLLDLLVAAGVFLQLGDGLAEDALVERVRFLAAAREAVAVFFQRAGERARRGEKPLLEEVQDELTAELPLRSQRPSWRDSSP